MKKILQFIAIAFVTVFLAACGGGGSDTPPPVTSGSIYGKTTPGAIVGVVCFVDGPTRVPCTTPALTAIADTNGNYLFSGLTQKATYIMSYSKGGYYNNLKGIITFYDGFRDAEASLTLVPISNSSPPSSGFFGGGGVDGVGSFTDEFCRASYLCAPGGYASYPGKIYMWGNWTNYLQMSYDSTNNVVTFESNTAAIYGSTMVNGVSCGVGGSVKVYGIWRYRCSDLGIVFDRAAGKVTFSGTPVYHLRENGVEYGSAYPSLAMYARGILTFQPF